MTLFKKPRLTNAFTDEVEAVAYLRKLADDIESGQLYGMRWSEHRRPRPNMRVEQTTELLIVFGPK